MTKMFVASC